MKRVSAAVLAVIVLASVAGAVPASGSPPQAGPASPVVSGSPALSLASPAQEGARVFLPVLLRRRRACPADSPFSLQIAALHQVEAAAGAEGQGVWSEWYTQAFPSLVQALVDSGACSARVLIDWDQRQRTEPLPGQPPTYNWNPGGEEDRLRALAGTGIGLIATVEMVPSWARGEPFPDLRCTAVDPAHLPDFAQFLTDLVNRYKGPPFNIHTWELRNEPDGTTEDRALVGQGCAGYRGDLYAQMLAAAYPAIKAADPAATVLMGGVAYDAFTDNYPVDPDGLFYRYFPDDVMADGGGAYVDAVTFHYFHDFQAEWERWDPESEDRQMGWLNAPTCGDVFDGLGTEYYAGGIDLIAKLTHFRNRLAACFGVVKPVWITELAEHGVPGVPDSLAQQARYVIQGYARGLSEGAVNITWFALISPPYDDQNQGLIYQDADGTLVEKPAFYAYKATAAELTGWHYAGRADAPGVEGYHFRDALNRAKTVAWGSGTLTFAGAGRLRVVDRWSAVTWIDDGGPGDQDGTTNGSIRVRLTADPVFISE